MLRTGNHIGNNMPRAQRIFQPGLVWHLTHRCHRHDFLLKFARDRGRYLTWLFQARKRFGMCVLDYMVTSNHVHLLVKDRGRGEISKGMQLIAGRTAQEFNQRKNRQGAFWEDRYHATAIESDEHLHRCIAYIDLNMVRAGVVRHPQDWPFSGYRQIQSPPQRYSIIDLDELIALCGFEELTRLQRAHRQWVDDALQNRARTRDGQWSSAVALGTHAYVVRVFSALGSGARRRQISRVGDTYVLREPRGAYEPNFAYENEVLSENTRHR